MKSSTQRSLDLMRRRGYYVQKVEQWIAFKGKDPDTGEDRTGGIRRDLWNCDLIALHPDPEYPPVLVQVTSASNRASRAAKLIACEELRYWLRWAHVELHTWRQAESSIRARYAANVERFAYSVAGKPVFFPLTEFEVPVEGLPLVKQRVFELESG